MGSKIKYSQLAFFLLSFAVIFSRFIFSRVETQDIHDGFSLLYRISNAMVSVVCAISGIWILRKILLCFFLDGIAALTMALIVLGSNYFQLTAYDGAMPHNYLFTLYALIVWLTIRWHEIPRKKYAFSLGLAIGLAILVRPTSAVIILVPLLWGIADKESLQRKWILIKSNLSQVIFCILFLAAVAFLKILSWKIQSSSFFFYSNEPDEELLWIAPNLWQVLFSFKTGWFVYSPILIFSLIGFYFLADKNKAIFFATFLFFMVNLAVIASWPTWWYRDSLGQLALIESYVILAIPFGYLLQWMVLLKPLARVAFFFVFLFFILLNLFETWQYMNFPIDPSNMTKEYYFLKQTEKFNIRVLSNYDFEKNNFPASDNLVTDIVKNGQYAYRMDTGIHFSPGLRSSYAELSEKSHLGIRVTAWIYTKVPYSENPGSLIVTSNHEGLNYHYETISFDKENLKPGQWNQVIMYYLAPESPDPKDIILVYVWFFGKKEMYIDDLKIELFEPKE